MAEEEVQNKMAKCSFCGEVMKRGTGKIFVKKDASLLYFCSSKCEKNTLTLKRKPIKTKWSLRYEKTTKKEK